uniref:Uncharacterized protein n=1 Tax=Arundo donax TaxID=35708 RepID=A0A0A9FB66_ARUDO
MGRSQTESRRAYAQGREESTLINRSA